MWRTLALYQGTRLRRGTLAEGLYQGTRLRRGTLAEGLYQVTRLRRGTPAEGSCVSCLSSLVSRLFLPLYIHLRVLQCTVGCNDHKVIDTLSKA